MRFTVTNNNGRGYVLDDGVVVFGPNTIAQAEEKRDALERKARHKIRKCLTCPQEFMSEGPHNRMCGQCRKRGASAESVAV
tara:strand:+ start:523 stop:765 length:243 start_codon:yes stop_codon:yes gene_type:complete